MYISGDFFGTRVSANRNIGLDFDILESFEILKKRFRILEIFVSTSGTESPNPKHNTAFAVYKPIPGSWIKSSNLLGTNPPCLVSMMFILSISQGILFPLESFRGLPIYQKSVISFW